MAGFRLCYMLNALDPPGLTRHVMRKLGYVMLILGFGAVMFHAFNRINNALRVFDEQKKALPQRESF